MREIICERKGAKYIQAKNNLLIDNEKAFVQVIWKHVNEKTKVISAAFIL